MNGVFANSHLFNRRTHAVLTAHHTWRCSNWLDGIPYLVAYPSLDSRYSSCHACCASGLSWLSSNFIESETSVITSRPDDLDQGSYGTLRDEGKSKMFMQD